MLTLHKSDLFDCNANKNKTIKLTMIRSCHRVLSCISLGPPYVTLTQSCLAVSNQFECLSGLNPYPGRVRPYGVNVKATLCSKFFYLPLPLIWKGKTSLWLCLASLRLCGKWQNYKILLLVLYVSFPTSCVPHELNSYHDNNTWLLYYFYWFVLRVRENIRYSWR